MVFFIQMANQQLIFLSEAGYFFHRVNLVTQLLIQNHNRCFQALIFNYKVIRARCAGALEPERLLGFFYESLSILRIPLTPLLLPRHIPVLLQILIRLRHHQKIVFLGRRTL